jgi:hypothetical protein
MEPHERLDQFMNERRLELRMRWDAVASSAGIADVTVRAIRRGDNQPSELTQRRIEDALRWEYGSIATILAGGEPTPVEPSGGREDTRPEPSMAEILQRVAALEEFARERMTPEERRRFGIDDEDAGYRKHG